MNCSRTGYLILLISFICLWAHASADDGADRALPVYRLAVISERESNPSATMTEMSDLLRVLERRLQHDGVVLAPLRVADSIDQLSALLRRGEVDGFFEGAMAVVELSRVHAFIEPSLLLWRKGQRTYHSVFFVRNNSHWQDLDGLQGARLVFESERSTSAFRLPLMMLGNAGYELRPDSQQPAAPGQLLYRFAGSELNQAYWVDRGLADVGAFNNGDWERVPLTVREHLRIIGRSPEVPRWIFAIDNRRAPDLQRKMQSALLAMSTTQEGRDALMAASSVTGVELLGAPERHLLQQWARSEP